MQAGGKKLNPKKGYSDLNHILAHFTLDFLRQHSLNQQLHHRLDNVKVVSKLQAHSHLLRKASLLAVYGLEFARGVCVGKELF